MKFHYSRHSLNTKEKNLERILEIVPGVVSWSVLIGMFILSFLQPVIAAAIIIAFNLYWLLRLFYLLIFLLLSYMKLSREKKRDWMKLIAAVDRREIKALTKCKSLPPASKDIFHLVIIPIVREAKEIIEPTISSLTQGKHPSKQILVILAVEERAKDNIKQDALNAREKLRSHFLDLLVVFHPDGITHEARVKGANTTFAAREAFKYFSGKNIAVENVIVSCFDADTVVNPQYFSCLTYNYMICPDRLRSSFQPIPVYHNNIWDVPAFARVLDVGSSFFQLIEATNPGNLVTFSSHSMSFKALVEIGYWPVDMISDDSAIFWKAFIHYDGNYTVVPLYTTVSMDIAGEASWRKTFVNVYKQKRRWAWGVENFPIVMRAFLQGRHIPFDKKFKYGFKLFEGNISWATWPFILGIISWIPAFFTGREFSSSVLYYSAPRIKAIIFNLAFLGLATTSVLSLLLLPKRNIKFNFLKGVAHLLEWLLVPLISIFLSAIPALDAQTRLMLGRYMEFWVTEKKRKTDVS